MLFTVVSILILFAVLSLIFYQAMVEIWLPAFWRSKIGKRFKQRISFYIRRFFFDIRNNCIAHLFSLCESDGDEAFEPYLDSPLRTCPPCEFVSSPAKEGVLVEANHDNNDTLNPPRRRGGRGRGRGIAHQRGRRGIQVVQPVIRLPALVIRRGEGGDGAEVGEAPPHSPRALVPPPPPPQANGNERDGDWRELADELGAVFQRRRQLLDRLLDEANGRNRLNREQ